MKSFLVSVLFVVFMMLGCAGAPHYTATTANMVRHTAVVQVELPFGWVTIGSGVAVRDEGQPTILTAKHVVEDGYGLNWRACSTLLETQCVELDLDEARGPVFSERNADDWIKIPVESFPKGLRPALFADSRPLVGEEVWVAGAPNGEPGEVTSGRVTRVEHGVYFVDARILPGNSGGPVYNERGRLVGLATAIRCMRSVGCIENWGVVTPISKHDL